MTTAKDIAALPLSAQTLIGLTALRESLHNRIADMARAIHLIRGEGFPYRVKKGSFDYWNDLETNGSHMAYFAVEDADPANVMIEAVFKWWCGDSPERHTVAFPIGYLDMTEPQWRGVEQAKVDALKADHDAKAARAAEKAEITRAQTIARAKVEAREKAAAEIPGFDALPRETREAIVANMVKG